MSQGLMAEITQQRDDQKPVWGDLIDLGLMCKVEQMLFVQRKSHLLCKTQTLYQSLTFHAAPTLSQIETSEPCQDFSR